MHSLQWKSSPKSENFVIIFMHNHVIPKLYTFLNYILMTFFTRASGTMSQYNSFVWKTDLNLSCYTMKIMTSTWEFRREVAMSVWMNESVCSVHITSLNDSFVNHIRFLNSHWLSDLAVMVNSSLVWKIISE